MNTDKKLIMSYEKGQTPIERLRNLLTPLINMSELLLLLKEEGNLKIKKEGLEQLIFEQIEQAVKINPDIKNYLSDAETLYVNTT